LNAEQHDNGAIFCDLCEENCSVRNGYIYCEEKNVRTKALKIM